MQEKVKFYLMIAGIFALIVLPLSAMLYAYSYTRSVDKYYQSFSVSAEGKVIAKPDVAKIIFRVINQNGDLEKLQKENTERTNSAIEFIKSKGIDPKDIQTQSYLIEPRYEYYPCKIGPCPPPKISGYSITQTILIKIRNFELIGEIISGIVERGVNSVSGPYFAIDDPTELQNQARKIAIEKAIKQAKIIAEAGGFQIGKLISIEESPSPIPYSYELFNQGATMDGGASIPTPTIPTIEPGSQEITVTVTLSYSIK